MMGARQCAKQYLFIILSNHTGGFYPEWVLDFANAFSVSLDR